MNDKEFVTREEFEAKIDMLLIANDAANKRIDDLRDSMNRNFALFGIAASLFAVLLAGLQIAIVFLH